ncbi:MAG: Patatin [Candidatus Cloacimonetes bacterium HGW-Cloacimonetes-1]|jgi:NTE family protein|nr:MAG: Patatin [Candidatus Cloacimonetes bacterium HGW-Cloacimonetes-1]
MKKNAKLILGGGAALGLAHIGVLAAIEEHFTITGIVGTSMGAIVGGLYCGGYTPLEILDIAGSLRKSEIFNPLNLDFTLSGIFDGKSTHKNLDKLTRHAKIEDAKIPFVAIAYDLITNRSIIIDKGLFVDAMRASSSVPYIYAPYTYGKYLFVDGGVEHPLPMAFSDEVPGEVSIAVNVLPAVRMQAAHIEIETMGTIPRFKSHQVFLQSVLQNQGYVAIQAIINNPPNIAIDAYHPKTKVYDFESVLDLYDWGKTKAAEAIINHNEPDFIDKMLASYQHMLSAIKVLKN